MRDGIPRKGFTVQWLQQFASSRPVVSHIHLLHLAHSQAMQDTELPHSWYSCCFVSACIFMQPVHIQLGYFHHQVYSTFTLAFAAYSSLPFILICDMCEGHWSGTRYRNGMKGCTNFVHIINNWWDGGKHKAIGREIELLIAQKMSQSTELTPILFAFLGIPFVLKILTMLVWYKLFYGYVVIRSADAYLWMTSACI